MSYSQIAELLRAKPTPATIMVAEVIAVQGEVCTVEIAGAKYEDVRLKITDIQEQDSLLVTPKIGSNVLVADLSGGDRRILAVIGVESPTEIALKKGLISLEISNNGFKIENNGVNLKTVLDGFLDEVMKIIVIQGTSPNVPALTLLKTQLSQILY